eukprot:GHVR01145603.1.p1 GENE.GHVR01145603.1~~GHVR01145603.1.p1  ORF type:complete len:135 (+),score=15.35 GHVR01145603.1:29-406(+)
MTKITLGKKAAVSKAKKQTVRLYVDCAQPMEDNILDPSSLEKYFKDRIKVNGKTSNLGEKVSITREKSKVVVNAELPFSKRYLKYLTKRYLKKHQLRDFLRVIAPKKEVYELRYFNINQENDKDD